MPGKNGGTLRRGNPRNHGGRPRDEFVEKMRELESNPQFERQLRRILSDADHPHFVKAAQFVLGYAYGRPELPVAVDASEDSLAALIKAAYNRPPPPKPHPYYDAG